MNSLRNELEFINGCIYMNYKYTHWKHVKPISGKNPFETLLDLFQQLLTIASGDVSQSLKWLTNIDKEYEIHVPSASRFCIYASNETAFRASRVCMLMHSAMRATARR